MNKCQIYEKNEFTNIRHLVEWASDKYGEQYAYSFRTDPHGQDLQKITFSEFAEDVHALASELLSMGCAGKHCALIGKMSYEWALTYFAVLCIGAVLVPLDRDWQQEDLADTVQKADVSFLFGEEEISDKLSFIAEQTELSEAPILLASKNSERSLSSLLKAGR